MEETRERRKVGRGAVIAAAAVAMLAVAVVAVLVLRGSGALGGGVMGKLDKLGVANLMDLTEEEIVAKLGEPDDRSETDSVSGEKTYRNVNLTYGSGERGDILIHLFTRDVDEEPAIADWVIFRSSQTHALGITPGVSGADDVRQSLDKQGVYYMENDFDLNYYGTRDVMDEDEGWFVTYQEDDLSYLIRYDAEGEHTVRTITACIRRQRDTPGGMFTCTQLTERLGGEDPITLLGMTEGQAESRFGFCGDYLYLAKDFYSYEDCCRIRTNSMNGTGDGIYTTIELKAPGLAVQGVEVGVTSLDEADARLTAAGAREFTREADAGVLRGTAYRDLDLEELAAQPLPEDRRVYLAGGWSVELEFQGGLLSAAMFTTLERSIDLTPPEPKELYHEAELLAAYEKVYRQNYLYSISSTLLADLTHDGIPDLLVMSDTGREGGRRLDVYAAPDGSPKRIYSAEVNYANAESGYYCLYAEEGQDYLFHGYTEYSIGQPAKDMVYSLSESGQEEVFRSGFQPGSDSRINEIVRTSTALIRADSRYTGNLFEAPPAAPGITYVVHGIPFTIELPDDWKDLCTVEENGDIVSFYYTREYQGPNIGFLFDVGYYSSEEQYWDQSSVLAQVPGGVLVATFPSDVQFDPSDAVSMKEYMMLQDQVHDVLGTVKVQ